MSDAGKPFTMGWKVAVVLALLIALGNSGVNAFREQEERRFHNHEKRIDDLENKIRELQATIDGIKRRASDKGD